MKTFLVFGDKTFKITVQDDDQVTFGPFSPPTKGSPYSREEKAGTLRIYRGTKQNIIACFAGVHGFRELSLDYSEQVAKEEGAVIWNSDKDGYQRQEKMQRTEAWVDPTPKLEAPKPKRRRK